MGVLTELLKKEIKETFRNPRYIIFTILFPLILFPAVGYLYNFSFQTAQERVARLTIYIVDLDQDNLSLTFKEFLQSALNISIVEIHLDELNHTDYLLALVIPEDFTESFRRGEPSQIIIKTRIGSLSFTALNVFQRGVSIVEAFESALRRELISRAGLDADFLNNMIETDAYVYIEEWRKEVRASSLATLAFQIFLVPWLVFGLVISILQVSAAMLSEEKEYKTLETLLTLPINRKILALEKILGSMVVAFAATAAYSIGFIIYIIFLGAGGFGIGEAGLSEIIDQELFTGIKPEVLALLSILFFLTILITGGLGLLLSLFTQDTKTAEGLTATVSMPIFVLILFGALIDISILPEWLRMIYYSIPFVYLLKSFEYLLVGRLEMYVVGIIVNVIWLIAVLILVARMFESERLLTMKISFGFRLRRSSHAGE